MTGTKYLSELVDCSALQKGRLNVIKAPTGSGKTYFALHHIPSLVDDAIHNVVYLIDTVNGKEQILQLYNAIPEYRGWSKEIDTDGIWFVSSDSVVILTYAKFGYLCAKYPGFYNNFSYIICDEIHSLLKFQYFCERPNIHTTAREALESSVKNSTSTVIALTATPGNIKSEFHAPSIEIPINQDELKQYSVAETVTYTSLDYVLSLAESGSVGLCYFKHISQMKDFEKQAKNAGFSPVCIWSINNREHPMTEEQLEARRTILEKSAIPPQYDLLIINSSSETSLKIKSPVDYVIVHCQDVDTQIQVRGRVNSDLKTLYLPIDGVPFVKVPNNFLGKKLFTQDKRELMNVLNLRNKNNRSYGWHTVKNILIDNDYSVTEKRSNNLRYVIIQPNTEE